jgi:hypothetical protein
MIKLIHVLTATCLFFYSSVVFAWDGVSSDISWYSTSQNEYHIKNGDQLKGLSDLVLVGNTFEDKTIILDNDIDLGYNPWQPIGGNAYNPVKFNGVFDGQKHKITAVHPVLSDNSFYSTKAYGLFARVGAKSVIKNLIVTGGANISPIGNCIEICAGGIAGESYGEIENVQTDFNISADDKGYTDVTLYVGGICGDGNVIKKAKSSGSIKFAYANVYWRANDHCGIGGIVGRGKEVCEVQSDCEISAWAKNFTSIGGICGLAKVSQKCMVENACFYGSLSVAKEIYYEPSALYTACSGIVGAARECDTLTVSNCISAPTNYSVYVGSANLFWPRKLA